MKQARTYDASTKTQTRPLGGGLLQKARVLALLMGLPLGTSLLSAGEDPHSPHYRFTELTLPGPSYAVAISDHGLVSGYYTDPASGDVLSFVLERGVLTTGLAAPGATITAIGDANHRGVETGNYGDETNQQAVLYDIRTGTYTLLPEIPGLPFSFGQGINDFGHVCGVSYTSGDWINGGNGLGQNWIWDGEDYRYFTVPDAVNGAVVGGINNGDQVSGYYVDNSGTPHGFAKEGPSFATLDAPGAVYTLGFGINNPGVVVGRYVDASGGHHGYYWLDGKFVTVDANISGTLGTQWIGLNDQGDLAGNIWTAPGHTPHAVIAERMDENEDSNH